MQTRRSLNKATVEMLNYFERLSSMDPPSQKYQYWACDAANVSCSSISLARMRPLHEENPKGGDIRSLPRIAYPNIGHCSCSQILSFIHHSLWQVTLFRLVLILRLHCVSPVRTGVCGEATTRPTYVKNEDAEVCALVRACLPSRLLDVFLQLPYRILECRSGVIHFVHDQYVLADEVGHFQRRKVEPLSPSDFGAWCLHGIGRVRRWELLVEGEANGLDGDIRSGWTLEEGSIRDSVSDELARQASQAL